MDWAELLKETAEQRPTSGGDCTFDVAHSSLAGLRLCIQHLSPRVTVAPFAVPHSSPPRPPLACTPPLRCSFPPPSPSPSPSPTSPTTSPEPTPRRRHSVGWSSLCCIGLFPRSSPPLRGCRLQAPSVPLRPPLRWMVGGSVTSASFRALGALPVSAKQRRRPAMATTAAQPPTLRCAPLRLPRRPPPQRLRRWSLLGAVGLGVASG